MQKEYPNESDAKLEELLSFIIEANDEFDPRISETFLKQLWKDSRNIYKLTLVDNGSGMSIDTILNNWLVPSTDNKLKKQKTSKNRFVQGRKGIGRYAASILGSEFVCESVDELTGYKSTIIIDWSEFENPKYKYLDEVPILIESFEDFRENHGTKIQIQTLFAWNNAEIVNLVKYLQRLFILPILDKKDKFEIKLSCINFDFDFDGVTYTELTIEPENVLSKAFHYKVTGVIEIENGKIVAKGQYINGLEDLDSTDFQKVLYEIPLSNYCGKIKFDLRAFDQDDMGIEALKKKYNNFLMYNNSQIRKMLERDEGISIYRNNFKIRPYGDDKGFDWLRLNARRINQPSRRLGTNQLNGLIEIDSEENSGLIEKASREGLIENERYDALRSMILAIIVELENERNRYRDNSGKRKKQDDDSFDELFIKALDFSNLYSKVETELKKAEVSIGIINDVAQVIKLVENDKKGQLSQLNEVLQKQEDTFKNSIATYQVQATLGKIINVVLHEGRNPLSYLKEQSKNLAIWARKIKSLLNNEQNIDKSKIDDLIETIISRSDEIKNQSNKLINLFSKLNTISISKRNSKKDVNLEKMIKSAVGIFENQITENKITVTIKSPMDISLNVWEFDIVAAFTNLIENSIYWLAISQKDSREILINVLEKDKETISITYQDNGIGIKEEHIKEQRIFEPGFTTKSHGTGLGLAIAGDSIERNGGTLTAVYNPEGVEFHIILKR